MRRAILFCLLPLSLALAARAEWPRLPPVEGELAGKIASSEFPSAPPIDWKITARAGENGRRHAELTAEATGVRLRVQADVDAATGDGSWRVDAGEIDTVAWFPVAAAKLGDPFGAAEVTGKISIAGEGVLRAGAPAGAVTLALAGGRFALTKPKLEITGLTLRVTLPELPRVTATGELAFAECRVAGVVLSEGRLRFAVDDERLQVTEARARGLGGTLVVAPFRVALADPAVALTIKLSGIALEEIVALLPSALSEARGRVDGECALTWSQAAGLGFGAGWLRLNDSAPATVRLAPTPGLITAQLKVGNPAFAPLRRVELGETPLHVRLLSVDFQPAGDALGRTATVKLEAEPVDPQLIAPLLMEVNVAGPLDQLIKLGLDDRMHVGAPR